jgi:hypothetical protein
MSAAQSYSDLTAKQRQTAVAAIDRKNDFHGMALIRETFVDRFERHDAEFDRRVGTGTMKVQPKPTGLAHGVCQDAA